MENATLSVLERRLEQFLQGSENNMRARGFMQAPHFYRSPMFHLQKERQRVISDRFFLTFSHPDHSRAFFLLFNGYHWADDTGTEVIIVHLHNQEWERELLRNATARARLGNTAAILPEAFSNWLQEIRPALPPPTEARWASATPKAPPAALAPGPPSSGVVAAEAAQAAAAAPPAAATAGATPPTAATPKAPPAALTEAGQRALQAESEASFRARVDQALTDARTQATASLPTPADVAIPDGGQMRD